MKTLFNNKNLLALMALSMALVPLVASATTPFAVPDTDLSKNLFLDQLFGPLTGASDESPLSEVIRILNSGILFVAGILVAYTIIMGTLSTAHDGEALGKKWSSLWIPIRTSVGTAAILPVIGGGFCTIQMVVVWLALQGVGMANMMWQAYLKDPMEGAFFVPQQNARQVRSLVEDMYRMNLCTSANQVVSAGDSPAAQIAGMILSPAVVDVRPEQSRLFYGPRGDACGRLIIDARTVGSSDGSNSTNNNLNIIGYGHNLAWGADDPQSALRTPAASSALVSTAALRSDLSLVHRTQVFDVLQPQIQALTDRIAASPEAVSREEVLTLLDSLTRKYVIELSTTARESYEANADAFNGRLVEGMRQDGWLTAGMYYVTIARSMDEITRMITEVPTATYGAAILGPSRRAPGDSSNWFHDLYATDPARRDRIMSVGLEYLRDPNASGLAGIEEAAESDSWVMKALGFFVKDDIILDTNAGPTPVLGVSEDGQINQNPILMVKNVGENLITVAWTGLALGAAALIIGSGLVAGTGVGPGLATVVTPLLMSVWGMLIVPGAIMSTYVPMIPYILWLGVVVGWVVLVVEAVIGAPLWALSHIAPDGDGIVGRGGQGYMLILSLVLRPALSVLGLVCSIILMRPLGTLVNTTFLSTFAMSVNPGPFAITQLVAGSVIYMIVMITLVHRVFGLMHMIPSRILRWIGGSDHDLGQEAQAMEQTTTGKAATALGAMQQVGQLTQSLGQGARDLRANQLREGQAKADKQRQEMLQNEEMKSRQVSQEISHGDQSFRASQMANTAIGEARTNPQDPAARQNAAFHAGNASQARMEESQFALQNAMNNSGLQHRDSKGNVSTGMAAFQKMSGAERQAYVSDPANPESTRKMVDFASKMEAATQRNQAEPGQGHLANFMDEARREHGNTRWGKAAGQGLQYEQAKEEFSRPPSPSTSKSSSTSSSAAPSESPSRGSIEPDPD